MESSATKDDIVDNYLRSFDASPDLSGRKRRTNRLGNVERSARIEEAFSRDSSPVERVLSRRRIVDDDKRRARKSSYCAFAASLSIELVVASSRCDLIERASSTPTTMIHMAC